MYSKDKDLCLCGKCGNLFSYKDAIVTQRNLYGIKISDKHCPQCNSTGFTIEKYKGWLDSRHKNLNCL